MIFKNIEDSKVSVFDLNTMFNSLRLQDLIVAPSKTTIGISGEEETLSECSEKQSIIVTPEVDLPIKVYNSSLIEITKNDYLIKKNYLSEYSSEIDKKIVKNNLDISSNSNVLELFDENENVILTIDFNKYTSFTTWGIPLNNHRYWWDLENDNAHFTFCDVHSNNDEYLYYYDYIINLDTNIATFNYWYEGGEEGYNKIARIFNEYEAGENISIDGNFINCTVDIDEKQDKLSTGKGITITDNIISSDIAIVELTEEEYLNLTTKEKNTIYNIINLDDCVNLGLPSGTLWATHNVGAENPEDCGDVFAWGETIPYGLEDKSNLTNYNYTGSYIKNIYSWNTYKYANGSKTTLTKYNNNSNYGIVDNKIILEPEDDAATVNFGNNWATPTLDQMEELKNKCAWSWITKNNINGYLITGPNGNSIFLPSSAWVYDNTYVNQNKEACYWISNLNLKYPYGTYFMYFNSTYIIIDKVNVSHRYYGRAVRPVKTSLTYKYIYFNGNKYESINDLKSYSISESITSLTPSKLIVSTISSSQAFGLANIPESGLETHVIIYNSGSSDITITIPTTGNYINCGDDTITISAKKYGEINALSDGSKVYLRAL